GPGRAANGNFVLTEFVVTAVARADLPQKLPASVARSVGSLAAPLGAGVFGTAAAVRGDGQSLIRSVALHKAQADFSQEGFPVASALEANPAKGWAIAPQFGKAHVAGFETKAPLSISGGVMLTFTLGHRYAPQKIHNLGRFRLSVTS